MEEVGEELDHMCNLADIVLERGIEKGIEKGIEQGIKVFILDNLEEAIPEERILEKLQKRFGLMKEEAESVLTRYK